MNKTLNQKLYRSLLGSALVFLGAVQGISQNKALPIRSLSGDSTDCNAYISTYRQFILQDYYDYAIEPWRRLFDDCPSSSERMYVDGVTMYRSFIEEAPEGPFREALIDTLMLIYDRRMEYFGGEGNVKGRKGRDLFNYRRGDPDELQKAYDLLRTSIRLQGAETQEAVLVYYMSSSILLDKANRIDGEQTLEDYSLVMETLENLKGSSLRRERTRETIDEMVRKENILDCENIDRYVGSRLEENRQNETFLKKAISLYAIADCEESDRYLDASESLYGLDPSPVAAHDLALLFIARNELQKAIGYLDEALVGEIPDPNTSATWHYERGLVRLALGDHCAAIDDAREAIRIRSDYGKAYLLLGDAYIESRTSLGDEVHARTAFWAAADQYRMAEIKDPAVAEEARRKLMEITGLFMDREDIFFLDLKEGDPYQVGGCINETTTVRPKP